MKQLPKIEWMFFFEGGGWNSVYAKTKRGAISEATKRFKGSETLIPIPSSFRKVESNPELYKSAINLFY